MTTPEALRTVVAPLLGGAARVALGVLWLNEGVLKYRAHFGAADILLVANGAQSNARVPEFFKAFTMLTLHSWPDLAGLAIPFLELSLGIALIIGVLTLPAALMSVLTLMTYWLSDQLIGQYPVMVALAVVVIASMRAASRFSATTLIQTLLRRRNPNGPLWSHPVRSWL